MDCKSSKSRLFCVKEHLHTNYTELAKILGYDRNTIYEINNGRAEISKNFAFRIHNAFPEISYEWLLTGEGEMLDQSNINTITAAGSVQVANGNNNTQSIKDNKESYETILLRLNTIESLLYNNISEKDKQIAQLLAIIDKLTK